MLVAVLLSCVVWAGEAPRLSVEFLDAPYLVRLGVDQSVEIPIRVSKTVELPVRGMLVLSTSSALRVEERRVPLDLAGAGRERIIPISVVVHEGIAPNAYFVNVYLPDSDRHCLATVRALDLAVPEGIHVGVVQSQDSALAGILTKMGIPNETLAAADCTADRLHSFASIIVNEQGVTEAAAPSLDSEALLAYVSSGGNLVVMQQRVGQNRVELAPYPIPLSESNTPPEEIQVTVNEPDHAAMTTPNVLSPEDWVGWTQDGGLHLPQDWDEEYTSLVTCSTSGAAAGCSGLLVAQYGSGTYVYLSLPLEPQARDLHPGSLRLLSNILALGAKTVSKATQDSEAQP